MRRLDGARILLQPRSAHARSCTVGIAGRGGLCRAGPSLFAVRGWSSQGSSLAIATAFYSLAAGALISLDPPARRQPHRAWWVAWAFLFAALLTPLAFNKGAEGEWVSGGLPQAGSLAVLGGMLACIIMSVVLLAARSRAARWTAYPTVPLVVGIVSLAVNLGLYVTFGRVGLQPDTFFVVMKDQTDTCFAQNIAGRDERLAAVYTTLTGHALTTQADLRATLDAQGVAYTPYYLVNGLEVKGNPFLRHTLARRPDVARILDSPHFRPQPPSTGRLQLAEERKKTDEVSWGVAFIKVNQVWAHWNITGQSIIVGAMGNGVDWLHPDVHAQYLGSAGHHDYTWFDPWVGTSEPVDTNGIGTHLLGTMVDANGIGVAPDARWIACRSLARDLGNPALYLDCTQFLFAPFPQHGNPFTEGEPMRGAHIVNGGWYCPPWEGCDAITLSITLEHLRNAGQMFVAVAGNDGPACGTIGPPGLADAAFTVGAVDRHGIIADFSGRGPVTLDGSGRTKPDVVAPGVGILSNLPDGRYAEFGGTSMAVSHVVGLVALLWSANPALIGDIHRTEQIMTETVRYIPASNVCGAGNGKPNNVYGFGVVDALKAVRAALNKP